MSFKIKEYVIKCFEKFYQNRKFKNLHLLGRQREVNSTYMQEKSRRKIYRVKREGENLPKNEQIEGDSMVKKENERISEGMNRKQSKKDSAHSMMTEGVIQKDGEIKEIETPRFLKVLLSEMLEISQKNLKSLKECNNIPIDDKFVSNPVFACQFCGKEFPKPCSLGGHVSKLHQSEKKESLRMQTMKEKPNAKRDDEREDDQDDQSEDDERLSSENYHSSSPSQFGEMIPR